MRTPANKLESFKSDKELVLGLLFSECLFSFTNQIRKISQVSENKNKVRVEFKAEINQAKIKSLKRFGFSNSSCGVCGKVEIKNNFKFLDNNNLEIRYEKILEFNQKIKNSQKLFNLTAGSHAAAFFSYSGEFLSSREDVGRHNAVDKLIGTELIKQGDGCYLSNKILFTSGRVSYEIMQKALTAGICFVAAVGAPTSLAVEMAEKYNMTLIGFLSDKSFNVYAGEQRIYSDS